jgi:hypothetical protein
VSEGGKVGRMGVRVGCVPFLEKKLLARVLGLGYVALRERESG